MNKIESIITELATPLCAELNLKLWDVTYTKEGGDWFLRVFIDKEGGVSIDDCEKLTRLLDPKIDELDPIAHSYMFEVGSAGLERSLKRPENFLQFLGHKVELKLYKAQDGAKKFEGVLLSFADNRLSIQIEDTTKEFQYNDVASAKLRI